MNDIHNKRRSALKKLERIARNDMIFVFIITVILLIGMGVFGYIVGFTNGHNVVGNETSNVTEPRPVVIVPLTEEKFIDETPEVPCEALSATRRAERLSKIDKDELEMLACVIYQEAGGNRSCDMCRWYVADIVLNRVNHPKFPNTIEDVLTAHGQYGLYYKTGIVWPERAKYDSEKEAVARAYTIAEEVLSGQHSIVYGKGYVWQAQFVQGTDGFWCCNHYYGRG